MISQNTQKITRKTFAVLHAQNLGLVTAKFKVIQLRNTNPVIKAKKGQLYALMPLVV